MIIARTPMRISFFGGGSDYPAYYKEHGGACLNATINKYGYITARYLPPFFEHKYRVVWSQIENVQNIDDIRHSGVQSCLRYMNINKGLEIHYDGDLPARSGLGTSSAFTVGLLNALHILQDKPFSKYELGIEAMYVEQNVKKENVGSQDQLSTACGGINFMKFSDKAPEVTKLDISKERIKELESYLMLVFTGFPHMASEIAGTYNFDKNYELKEMTKMAYEATKILQDGGILQFGELLHESWVFKKKLSPKISNPYIDYVYNTAREAGVIGGKVNGAGGGGFMTLFCEPDKQAYVKEKLGSLVYVPFKFEDRGTEVLFKNSEVNIG